MAKLSKSITPQITFGFLGLIGVVALVLGFSSLSNIINYPSEKAALERKKVTDRVRSANIAAEEQLRTQDTDADGLVDFDELNLYGTSPYLADSDSDGFSDKQEIESNNDPNCPTGATCRSVPVESGEALIDEGGVVLDNFEDLLIYEPGQEEPTIDLTNLNAEQIRELILQSGEMTAAQLSEIDDATIMQVYQQMIAEGAIETTTPAQPDSEVDLTDLNAEQIRELILQSGEMTAAQLSEIDDATIMQIYEQMLLESEGNL